MRDLLSGAAVAALAVAMTGAPARAGCTFAPTAGNDVFTCDGGESAGGLTDLQGSNSLRFPLGGDGVVNGDVTFGPGEDMVDMSSGAIEGVVSLGGGVDTFIIDAGQVAGGVFQGDGRDRFRMFNGQIASLSQGDSIDEFVMTGGRIVGYFEDGDIATMAGGRIGRVNMKLDDNVFDMSGGVIEGNLVTGFGDDTIRLSDGLIGGNVSVSGGDDSVSISGGVLNGEARLSTGNDRFDWSGGIVYGAIDLGDGDDVARLSNLTDGNMGATPSIAGGAGSDTLALDHVKTGAVARFTGWERVTLRTDSELIFDEALVLGDAGGAGTAALSLDASSSLFAQGAAAAVRAADGIDARLVNLGRIQMSDGRTGDRFTVGGDYVGLRGFVLLDAELGDDASASDRLVIEGGRASGLTGLVVTRAGGAGAQTLADGILVVEAAAGATTTASAFALVGRVAAGPFEYMLYRGGVGAGAAENWYLRSTLPDPPIDPTDPPVDPSDPEPGPGPDPSLPPVIPPEPEIPEITPPPPPPPDPGDPEGPGPELPSPPDPGDPDPAPDLPEIPTTPPDPGGGGGDAGDPLWRPEVAAFSAAAPAARQLALATLGTFHQRRGDQRLVLDEARRPATWARLLGQRVDLEARGDVAPEIDGTLWGVQAGLDLLAREGEDGTLDRFGLFLAHATLDATTRGDAVGREGLRVGSLDAHATSLGATWTRTSPVGWYLDAVLMATWYGGDAEATTDERIDVDGTAATASIEGGRPFALGAGWTAEPQAQLVWQRLSLDDQRDGVSSVDYDLDASLTGRVGLRLEGDLGREDRTLRPFAVVNIWHGFDADATVSFAGTPVTTPLGGTSVEIGAGVVAALRDRLNLYGSVDYAAIVDGASGDVFGGSVGLEWRF